MTISLECPGCHRLLELDSSPTGNVRCPACGHQFKAEGQSERPPVPAIASLRIPEGRIYGPMPVDQLEEWVCQGRVDDKCDVKMTLDGPWQGAAAVFPVLRLPPAVSSGNPFKAAPRVNVPGPTGPRLSERGVMIVLFGILGWVGCPVFAVMAWGTGAADLEAHRQGRLDAGSVLPTQIGYFMGVFATITWATLILGMVMMILFHQLL
ncbi:hypothetical protein LOC68_08620 [Blastopirellula sp. JC732]|uniref:DUF4190 domain-containing protein n=1 Tax=Blastopirellula sediminis TaxID=2894196 RepID=A0A9X1MKV8_9BACT|nr:hypothetical protein [Blastopirellula sediminis]MCC9608767.1 hypothetical protein [Blastopirellula sediminis]MCC9628456.1 hypothetical protein [Blastopirellula sediminis]